MFWDVGPHLLGTSTEFSIDPHTVGLQLPSSHGRVRPRPICLHTAEQFFIRQIMWRSLLYFKKSPQIWLSRLMSWCWSHERLVWWLHCYDSHPGPWHVPAPIVPRVTPCHHVSSQHVTLTWCQYSVLLWIVPVTLFTHTKEAINIIIKLGLHFCL